MVIQRPEHNPNDTFLLQKWREAVTKILSKIVTTDYEIEIEDSSKGIILRSPNNTRWRVTVNNAGALVVTSI